MTHWLGRIGFVLLCAAGGLAGALALGRTHAEVGPFSTTVALGLSPTGDTTIRLAPLGSLKLDTHDGPIHMTVSADEVDLTAARRVVDDPAYLDELDDEAAGDARRAVQDVVGRGALGAVLGALAIAAIRGPTRRRLAVAGIASATLIAGTAGVARATWSPNAIAQPEYTGVLTIAPKAIGSIARVRAQYDAYRSQLASLIGNVAELYQVASELRSFEANGDTARVLHVSDLHLNPQAFDLIAQIIRQFGIDAVVDSGDINDWGTEFEGQFVERIATLGVPYIYVRGNHDSAATAAAVAAQPNAVVLDGEVREVVGLRFWGIGDPRFTPDKTEHVGLPEERAVADRFAPEVAQLLDKVEDVDVVVVHDPRIAADVRGLTPLVLAGHLHRPSSKMLSSETRLVVEGSTGGAGLRTLEKEEAVALTCSVLYFDRSDGSLQAFDRVAVEGLGGTGA
ncbi:MAG: metallophosphoesterase family protein, partial [Actinobacteria bacterium]|nr:metallophosphoesterase family protein [Actinomycetota bacterium]MBW3650606.1 metallophosphoesterase family protein [Actinomycetota bacterium]